jgi:hypothetical protein
MTDTNFGKKSLITLQNRVYLNCNEAAKTKLSSQNIGSVVARHKN